MILRVPVAPGELLDKLLILEIKSERMRDPAKLENVRREHEALLAIWREEVGERPDLQPLSHQLKEVNQTLWEVEDRLRLLEAEERFDEEFVRLARSVYRTNDRRAALKREVNVRLGSTLREEKEYSAEDGGEPSART